jgi:predicted cobalt transporter CbtA
MAKHTDIERGLATGATTRVRTFVSRFAGYLARALAGSQETRDAWAPLTGCERFEQVVSLVLTVLISVLVIVTLLRSRIGSAAWSCSRSSIRIYARIRCRPLDGA